MTSFSAQLAPAMAKPRRRSVDVALWASGTVIAIVLIIAIIGPFVVPNTDNGHAGDRLLGFFTRGHLLGTDGQGRDVTWMGIPDDADYRSASFSVAIMCHRFTPLRTFQDASKTP